MSCVAEVEDPDDVGMAEPHAGLGFLVEPLDGVGYRAANGWRRTLTATGWPPSDLLAAIDPGERPLGQVEQDLAAAEEEAVAGPPS